MLRSRIIPTLLLHKKGLYKTVGFSVQKGKYVGDPINAIKIFNDKGVDELVFLDIDASRDNKEPDFSVIQDIASECFMPVAYGGGIKNIEQIKRIFSIGIEKVVLNSVLLEDKSLLEQASKIFGSQSIVAAVDVKKNLWGKLKVYNHVKKKCTKLDVEDYVLSLVSSGAGEIFLTSVEREGTFKGFDIETLKGISSKCRVPIIINGGASDINDMSRAIVEGGASAVSASSMFVFQGPHKAVLITYPKYSELEEIIGESSDS
jgi:cyclase